MVKYTAAADGVNPSPAWQLARCQLSHVNSVNTNTADSCPSRTTQNTPDSRQLLDHAETEQDGDSHCVSRQFWVAGVAVSCVEPSPDFPCSHHHSLQSPVSFTQLPTFIVTVGMQETVCISRYIEFAWN